MTLPETTRTRLETQLDALFLLIAELDTTDLTRRPSSGKWSVLENAAHLGRYHEVFLERMQRVLDEDTSNLGRYISEDDPEAAAWLSLEPDETFARLKEQRTELIAFVDGLEAEQLERTGIHPKLGKMTVSLWLEFFLLHEAHHLYRILWLSKTGE